MICHNSATKFRDVALEVYQVFRLFARMHIIEVNVFVSPLEIVNDTFICKLFLQNKNILEEVKYSFFDVKMIELGNHSLLIFEVFLILINESISLINYAPDVIKYGSIGAASGLFEACQLILECLIFTFLPHQLVIHVTDLSVVFVKLPHYHLVIGTAILH